MLNHRVEEIFRAEGAANSLERFLVRDRGTHRCNLNVVLLAESPHIDEVKPDDFLHRYPLAGATGHYVRKKLMDWMLTLELGCPPIPVARLPEQSIGELVYQGHTAVRRLGIMNVSWLPFQKGPYAYECVSKRPDDFREHDNWKSYIKCMDIIRGDPSRPARRRTDCRCLEAAIVDDLRERLVAVHENNPEMLLVCCGEVAQGLFEKTATNMPALYFPHPARLVMGGWDDLETRCSDCIVDRLSP